MQCQQNKDKNALAFKAYYTFFYKKHLYKELEAEKGSKNKELLRN